MIIEVNGEKLSTRFRKNSISFEEWCNINLPKEEAVKILNRWDYEKNGCRPSEISYSSHGFDGKGYWFKCDNHLEHESELKSIREFVYKRRGMTCRKCNSIAQYLIDIYGKNALELYWDFDKNIFNPWNIDRCSRKRVWIKCQEKDYHGSYNLCCYNIVNGNQCPYCSNKIIHPLDSLGKVLENKNLLSLWSEKNKESPYKYSPYSRKYAIWKCENNKHADFKKTIRNAHVCEFRCSKCMDERKESIIQEKVRLYLETYNYPILHEKNCTLKPINIIKPPTGNKNKNSKVGRLLYDNEIIMNNNHLFIETMGSQHERIELFHKLSAKRNGTTPEQELIYTIEKDKYKEQYVYNQGNNYYYLAIWYYHFDDKDTYKELIDNKINEIINKNKK